MRCALLALLLISAPALQACQPSSAAQNFDSDDANEDAALNAIRDEDHQTSGAADAVSGMIPDANGHVPMANVQ